METTQPHHANQQENRDKGNDEQASRQHDRYVRYALQHRKLFIPFLDKHLPPHVLKLVDLEKAQPCNPSTLDHSLRERIADAVYLIPLKSGNGHALVLVEHQSSPRVDMPVRLGIHLLRLSEAYRKSHQGKKSLMVFGLLYYNGEKPYNQPTDLFASLNEAERGVSQQTLGSLHLIDTHALSMKNDQENLMLHVFELATKHIFDPHADSTLGKLWLYLQALKIHEIDGKEFFLATCRYVLHMVKEENFSDIINGMRKTVGNEAAEVIMTLGQNGISWSKRAGKKVDRKANKLGWKRLSWECSKRAWIRTW
ncbi:MAG: Rpn family recombination-promoting nuclease/putative transposase [Spirochaetota bacterium]